MRSAITRINRINLALTGSENAPMKIRDRSRPRVDWQAIKDHISIEAVAVNLLDDPPGRNGSRGLWWHCRFHKDGNPSFTVSPEKGLYHCFGCGAGGDSIDLVMRLEGLTFPEAKQRLAAMFGFDGGPGIEAPPRRRLAPPKAPEKPPSEPSGLPREDAERVVKEAVAALWGPEGREALAYLRDKRFLSDGTIRRALLGFVQNLAIPKRDGNGVLIVSGVAIPWFGADGRLAKIQIRKLGNVRIRYAQAFADRPALFAPFGVRPGPVVIAEGEFDCLLLGQELGDRAAVVTLGSAGGKPSREARRALRAASRLLLATDGDSAGRKAAKRLREHFPQAERVRPPAPDTDWGELRAGGFGRIAYHWGRFLPLGDPPRPEDFAPASLYALPADERDRIEAQEERAAIQAEGEAVEGEAHLFCHVRTRERAEPEPIGPSLPSGGFEPEADDEAARLSLATKGETIEPTEEAPAAWPDFIGDRLAIGEGETASEAEVFGDWLAWSRTVEPDPQGAARGFTSALVATLAGRGLPARFDPTTRQWIGLGLRAEPIEAIEGGNDLETFDRLLSAAGFKRVDEDELDGLVEFDPPAADSKPSPIEAPAASRARPRRSTGAGSPSLFPSAS